MNITLTDEQAQNLGERIANLLNLEQIKSGDNKGRFETSMGTKTHKGLARTIISAVCEDKSLIAELKEILNKTD